MVIERATAEVTPTAAKLPIRLGIMQTFGAYWLIPRVQYLSQSRPSFELELVTVPVVKKLEDTNLDAVIVGGDYEPRPEIDGTRFMDDIVGPVMSPRLAETFKITNASSSMTGTIAIVTTSQPRLWGEWYKAAGASSVRFSKRREFDNMSFSIEAAKGSLGIAVVPRQYVDDYLSSGSLLAPFWVLKAIGRLSFPMPHAGCGTTGLSGRFAAFCLNKVRQTWIVKVSSRVVFIDFLASCFQF